ncbi:MAG TPA: hypothetical protein VNK48_02005 [Xanthobacteraceae bacterium]|nr:hypothetical protein [Xanthobacteraceae bacterium]
MNGTMPAAVSTEWSEVMGNVAANSLAGKSRPPASTVTFGSGAFIESKNGSTVTADLLSKRMISLSPM